MPVAKMDDEAVSIYLGLLIQAGCKVQSRTTLFGKDYVWMEDKYGQTFLERLPDE